MTTERFNLRDLSSHRSQCTGKSARSFGQGGKRATDVVHLSANRGLWPEPDVGLLRHHVGRRGESLSRPSGAWATVAGMRQAYARRRRTNGAPDLGPVDERKFLSSMTLFMTAAPDEPLFAQCPQNISPAVQISRRSGNPSRRVLISQRRYALGSPNTLQPSLYFVRLLMLTTKLVILPLAGSQILASVRDGTT